MTVMAQVVDLLNILVPIALWCCFIEYSYECLVIPKLAPRSQIFMIDVPKIGRSNLGLLTVICRFT